jgi:hypothetical protein
VAHRALGGERSFRNTTASPSMSEAQDLVEEGTVRYFKALENRADRSVPTVSRSAKYFRYASPEAARAA